MLVNVTNQVHFLITRVPWVLWYYAGLIFVCVGLWRLGSERNTRSKFLIICQVILRYWLLAGNLRSPILQPCKRCYVLHWNLEFSTICPLLMISTTWVLRNGLGWHMFVMITLIWVWVLGVTSAPLIFLKVPLFFALSL